MPKLVDHDRLRHRIRAAALAVFAARGVKGTGLAHVADQLGIGRSSLYHYYPDKTSLLADIARDLLAQEAAMFRAAVRESGSPRRRLEALIARLAGVLDEWAAVGPAVLDLRSISSRQFRRFYRRIRQDLASLIAEGQRARQFTTRLEPDAAASLVIATVDGLLLQHMADKQAIPRGQQLTELLLWSVRRLLAS
jgi:AcrR family transcriptional regulator